MMPDHEFCDNCPGCRPAMVNPETGAVLPNSHPIMVEVNRIWDNETTYDQRKAFIEVTLHNSRDAVEMQKTQELISMFKKVLDDA